MDIDLGCRMIVEFPNKERMNCQFVGMAVDEFLLLKVPLTPGIRDRMGKGVNLQFRYLSHGKIVSFRADVLLFQATPASLVFVSYPFDTIDYNLRKEGRIECNFPTELSVGQKTATGRITNINPSGCKFVFDKGSEVPTRAGAPVSGHFVTMEGERKYDFQGEIMTVKSVSNRRSLGIRFDSEIALPEKLQEILNQSRELSNGDSAKTSDS